ncbi:class I SAM-dependent methyltransferase [Methylobacterium mesophilicum]
MKKAIPNEERVSFFGRFLRTYPNFKNKLRDLLEKSGYKTQDWVRYVMYRECFSYIDKLGPQHLNVLEISAGREWRHRFKFGSYTETEYPDFDVCMNALPEKFDLIIADQIFEHLAYPQRAAENVYAMLKPGGIFIVATPFLIRVHNIPDDCNRWTESGLSYLLQEGGFKPKDIETHSWGNRKCVVANFSGWKKRGFFRSLRNEPNFPVMVWAYAKRSS